MAVSITEYATLQASLGRPSGILYDIGLPAATTVLAGATTSTMTLGAATNTILITSTLNCYVLCSGSSASTTIATATNCRITFAGTYDVRSVRPGSRLTCLSL